MADKITPAQKQEIAGTGPGRDITRKFTGDLALPGDSVLAAKGGGLELYEEVLRDAQVFSCLQQRRLAVVAREWEVIAGAEDKASQMAADFMREMLARIGFDRVTSLMHYGVFYGYAMAELLYAPDGQYWTIDAIKVRKARRFRFGIDGAPRLLSKENMRDGVALPERKFWSFATGADNDDEPYGLGLGHQCYWPVWFKRNGMKFWAVFLDRFGSPVPLGRYGASASEADQKKLLETLAAVQTDSGIIIPEGMSIEFLEAARGGTVDYATFHDRQESAIAKVILSQTMTTDDGSSLAQGKVHADVKDEVVKADSDLICGSFNDGPMKWLTAMNFAGATPPKVWRIMSEPEDLNLLVERDLKLFQMGFEPSEDYVRETYGDGWTRRRADGAMARQATQETQFAEKQGLTPEQMRADRLRVEADAPLGDWIAALKQAAMEASDLQALRAAIEGLRDSLSLGDMTAAMQKALAAAKLAGRADILAEAAGAENGG